MDLAKNFSPNARRGGLRILIVDDDAIDYLLVTRYLTQAGMRAIVSWTNTYEGAQALLAESVYDVVILDQFLGPHLGSDLVGLVREASTHCVTIILSGADPSEVLGDAFLAGADDVLVKSDVDGPSLVDRIHRLIAAKREGRAEQEHDIRILEA